MTINFKLTEALADLEHRKSRKRPRKALSGIFHIAFLSAPDLIESALRIRLDIIELVGGEKPSGELDKSVGAAAGKLDVEPDLSIGDRGGADIQTV